MAGGAYAFDSRRDHHLKATLMKPSEQNRLIEIMAELLIEVQGMRQEQIGTNARLDGVIQEQAGMRQEQVGMRQEQVATNVRLNRLEKRTEQNTAAIGELRVSVIKMADKLDALIDLSKRVQRLEDKIFV